MSFIPTFYQCWREVPAESLHEVKAAYRVCLVKLVLLSILVQAIKFAFTWLFFDSEVTRRYGQYRFLKW